MYSLRYTFASGLIAGRAPVTEVQRLMGHSSPVVTLKVYAHWFKDADSGAVGRLSATILGGAGTRHKHGTAIEDGSALSASG